MDTPISSRLTKRGVKFVLVNGRTPNPRSFCALCCKPIEVRYLREIGTRFSYCDPRCYADHCNSAVSTSALSADTA